MRTVPFTTKNTTAGTVYCRTLPTDRDAVLEQCKTIVDFDDECATESPIVSSILNRPIKNITRKSLKHGGGYNSARSVCEGVVDNFNKGQYDFSVPQLTAIEEAFKVAHGVLTDFWEIDWDPVSVLPKLKLEDNKVVKVPAKKEEPVTPESMIGEFFDIESITITYKRKA